MNFPEYLSSIPTISLVYCNRCDGDTRHEQISKSYRCEYETDGDGYPEFTETFVYITWRCMGCECVSLEERYTNDQMVMREGDEWSFKFHPERTRNRIKRKNFFQIPANLRQIYTESVTAFNQSSLLLCAIGLRSLIEGVCRQKDVGGRNLQERIDNLSGILPKNITNHLHSLRFMGNSASHELSQPSGYELRLAIGICEDILNFLYELDYKSAQLGTLNMNRRDVEKEDS